ncbi:MAG: protease complex subunit PrcB family protein [Bacteroidia bacterium]
MMKNVLLFLMVTLTLCNCQRKSAPQEADLSPPRPFTLSSTQGGLDSEFFVIINNEHDWEHLWREMLISGTGSNPPPLNFQDSIVAVAFQGMKGTGGYSVSIVEVVEKSNMVIVYAEYVSPGENCMVTQATSMPFAMIQLPKPEGDTPVLMEKIEKVDNCGEE